MISQQTIARCDREGCTKIVPLSSPAHAEKDLQRVWVVLKHDKRVWHFCGYTHLLEFLTGNRPTPEAAKAVAA